MFTYDEKRFFNPTPVEPACPSVMYGHSLPEKVEYTSRMMRDSLERLHMFEQTMKKNTMICLRS